MKHGNFVAILVEDIIHTIEKRSRTGDVCILRFGCKLVINEVKNNNDDVCKVKIKFPKDSVPFSPVHYAIATHA